MDHEKSNKKKKTKERRKSPRVAVKVWVKEKNEKATYYHLITNMSTDGFHIEKQLPFVVGSTVNLEIQLSDSENILNVKGRVINNYKDADSNFIGAGVKFIEMKDDVRATLAAYLKGPQS